MDAHDALERGPVDLIVDPDLSLNNPNNPTHTAGTTSWASSWTTT